MSKAAALITGILLAGVASRAVAQERMPRGPDLPGAPSELSSTITSPASFPGHSVDGIRPSVSQSSDCSVNEACPPACNPRIKVIVPPPEVVFRPCEKKWCAGLFHKGSTCVESCPPAPACPPAAPASGMISFNMTLSMPSLGYQGNSLFGSAALSGSGLMSGGLGLPFGAGTQGILPAAFTSGAPTSMEALVMRALLARALNGGDGLGLAPTARPESSVDNRLKEHDERLENLQKHVTAMDADTQLGVEAIAAMNRRLNKLNEELKRLEEKMGRANSN